MLLAIQDTCGLWGKTAEKLDRFHHLASTAFSRIFAVCLRKWKGQMKGKPRPSKQHKAREGEGQSMYEVLSPF